MLYNKRIVRLTAKTMILVMGAQLVFPVAVSALTTGPSQPEVLSFEPVGTTDMVDLFTGDFVYNIPLLDIEGYPVNISYHSGPDMEQEASWVGLGWNINPGVINRTVRGLPDDFNGETIVKELSIKPEKNVKVGLAAGAELLGVGSPFISLNANMGLTLNASNYRGISADITAGGGVNVLGMVSAGVDMGISSQNGADVNYNLGLSFNSSMIVKSDISAGLGLGLSHGYNTRSGVKDMQLSASGKVSYKGVTGANKRYSATVPIGLKNVVPVVTNSTRMTVLRGQLKMGGELFGIYPYAAVHGMLSTMKYDFNGSRKGYGYLYAQNAGDADILDFTRDRDGNINKTMKYLPAGNMTYDIYSVAGQGTGGSFRPFRNDYGSVFDPLVSSHASEFGMELEAGAGSFIEVGTDLTFSTTEIISRPWDEHKRPFTRPKPGSGYENVYFKQAGEATATQPGIWSDLRGLSPFKGTEAHSMPLSKTGSEQQRDPRGNLVHYFTAAEAAQYGVATSTHIKDYTSTNGFATGGNAPVTQVARTANGRKAHHISEMVQVQTDGSRYVFGLPAMNVQQSEFAFSVPQQSSATGLIPINAVDTVTNGNGRDNYLSKTSTPPFAHSYLLTSVLSPDYVDVTGDGVTDDDFGTYTKFNYSLKNSAFGWKAPYGNLTAQHDPGFKSDPLDDKASFVSGKREQWMLHSIESKNYLAEFYVSPRDDARGTNMSTDLSYKLDSIRLFNKHERFRNPTGAVPIKTVMFVYDYSLCKNLPNSVNSMGKLTLKRLYIRYGNSDKNMLSPYQFSYGYNPNYGMATKDRWGGYKPNTGTPNNMDYPFVDQNDPNLNDYAAAWNLQQIALPSGGTINVTYEADDYAYVQDKEAMEMFKIEGLGGSPNYANGSQLFMDKDNPNLYFYFKRKPQLEDPQRSFKDNYIKGHELLYYNCNTRLVGNKYEPIKGYADVDEIGACPNNGAYGYIKVKPTEITGGGAKLHPASYTAINFARYYLPHVLFPGQDPDNSSLLNILAGLQYAFSELVSFTQNPVKRMIREGKAQEIQLAGSYIRLGSVGLRKKGGGSRVKRLEFTDNWSTMAGGNTSSATYGKNYDYTMEDPDSQRKISSGVASYEPGIGGDENPYRQPAPYIVQSGSNFPPHDPIGVYQELPIGESLYPSAVVGYSKVTVTSIHKHEGISSQGIDVHEFYTARDFPIQAMATALDPMGTKEAYNFTEQLSVLEGSQGYTLVFNDMHGKPKRSERRIARPNTIESELVSYQQYEYFTENGKLSNQVPVMEYEPQSGKMRKTIKTVAQEADITIDTREKLETTSSNTYYINLNVVGVLPFVVPIPWYYDADFEFRNEFRSAVATKVIQQYGILKEVRAMNEGARTIVRNEAFDPLTGQALVTSVNNEYNDIEYSVNYPAYWGYGSMGPSYFNTGYEQHFDSVMVVDYKAELPAGAGCRNYAIGDELLITYSYNGTRYTNNVWVTDFKDRYKPHPIMFDCQGASDPLPHPVTDTLMVTLNLNTEEYPYPIAEPRFKYQVQAWPNQNNSGNGKLRNVSIKVLRSGQKNQLNESIQSYTTMADPFTGSYLKHDTLTDLIQIQARLFSDSLTAILPKYVPGSGPYWDSLNIYVNGTRQIKRLHKEYVMAKDREYANSSIRRAGLFKTRSLWGNSNAQLSASYWDTFLVCLHNLDPVTGYPSNVPNNSTLFHVRGYLNMNPLTQTLLYNSYMSPRPERDKDWLVARTITQWSPWGQEMENRDAAGNYTAAQYNFNNQLPVAVTQNARQHEAFAEGFEDFQTLYVLNSLVKALSSPYINFFPPIPLSGTPLAQYGNNGTTCKLANIGHTGKASLELVPGYTNQVTFNVTPYSSAQTQPRYMAFSVYPAKKYLLSYWVRAKLPAANTFTYGPQPEVYPKTDLIDGWQLMEGVITIPGNVSQYTVTLPNMPGGCYVDDIRVLPLNANMKSFVYQQGNDKLAATLDENNLATFYEYDLEGNLIRTKKETEKGIMTLMESRSSQKH